MGAADTYTGVTGMSGTLPIILQGAMLLLVSVLFLVKSSTQIGVASLATPALGGDCNRRVLPLSVGILFHRHGMGQLRTRGRSLRTRVRKRSWLPDDRRICPCGECHHRGGGR